MQNIRKISENIAHDGTHFFCLRCGKSGYDRMAQVRGHLAMCPGTAIHKGVVLANPNPNPARPEPRYIDGAYVNKYEGVKPVVQPAANQYNPPASAFSGGFHPPANQQEQQLGQVTSRWHDPDWEQRLSTLENESRHMLMSRNQPGALGDLFGRYKTLIICSALVLFAVAILSRNQCDPGSGTENKKQIVGDVGKKALTKLVDKGITKGVDALFKGISR